MKEYIRFEGKLFSYNRRNQFLFLGVIVFLVGLIVYMPYQNTGNIQEKIETEARSVRNAIAYVPMHEVEEGTYTDDYAYYDHLLRESRAVASQEVALTMYDDFDQYVTAGLQVTEERIQAHEQGYGTLPDEFIIPLSQSLREQEVYQYLQNHNIQIEPDALNNVNAVVYAMMLFSSLSFFFLLFLSSDVLTEDDEHKTIISAYPINANQKVIGKLIIQTLSSLIILVGLFVLGFVFYSLFFGTAPLDYPEAVYWRGSYLAVPTYLYILAFLWLFLIFVIHMVLLSAVMNLIFHNKYLNIFAGGSLFIISYLFSSELPFFSQTPLNYLNPAGILNGQLANQFNQPSNDLLSATVILCVWSILYSLILSVTFSRKNTSHVKQETAGDNQP